MNVLEIIKSEHRQVVKLIDEIASCEPGDDRLFELAKEIEQQLSLHLALEERLFYAPLRDCAQEVDEQVDVFEAYTEHAVAKALIEMLSSRRKTDSRFKAELVVLGDSVKNHVREEESNVFAIAREYLNPEELGEIGEAWEKAKARAQRAPSSGTGRKAAVRGTTASGTKAKTGAATAVTRRR